MAPRERRERRFVLAGDDSNYPSSPSWTRSLTEPQLPSNARVRAADPSHPHSLAAVGRLLSRPDPESGGTPDESKGRGNSVSVRILRADGPVEELDEEENGTRYAYQVAPGGVLLVMECPDDGKWLVRK